MKQLYRTARSFWDIFLTAFWENRNNNFKYLLIIIPTAIYLGMISFIGKNSGADFFLKSLQALAFATAGFFHFFLLYKKILFKQVRYFSEGVAYTWMTAVVICLTLLVFYLFTDNSMAAMAIVSGIAFAVPHTFLYGWHLYKNIPAKEYPIWTNPLNSVDVNELLMPETVTCRFSVSSSENQTEKEIHTITVPQEWKLGKAFFALLEKEKRDSSPSPIGYCNESGKPYAWTFHISLYSGLLKKRLEPEESISDNMLTRNSLIQVTRVNIELPLIHKIQYKTILKSAKSARISSKQTLKIYEDHETA